MGELAVEMLVERLENSKQMEPEIAVQPEIVVRESTGPARK
jgi:DNA-binding LacI/PurR family transcriptional regulator